MQLLAPDEYAALNLSDMWIEDMMQETEARWIVDQLFGYQHILELGWGSGIVTRQMLDAGKSVTVIDGSEEFCNQAHKAGAYPVHGMFEDAVTPRPMYDAVIASFVLEHVKDPVALLKRCRQWSKKLICVIGNANSYHRQLAVKMGLQPDLYTLSERDKVVGHYRVYDGASLTNDLVASGWWPYAENQNPWHGIMFKPLPNSMLVGLPKGVIKGMCEMDVPHQLAGNVGVVCVHSPTWK